MLRPLVRALGAVGLGVGVAALFGLWWGLPTGPVGKNMDGIAWGFVAALFVGAVVCAWRLHAHLFTATAGVLTLAVLVNAAILH